MYCCGVKLRAVGPAQAAVLGAAVQPHMCCTSCGAADAERNAADPFKASKILQISYITNI
jgi:hypothetical protein